MKDFFSRNNLIVLMMLYIVFVTFQKSYIWFLPALSFMYPNSVKESEIVEKNIQLDDSLFILTDVSVLPAFLDVLPDPSGEIEKVMTSENNRILFYKYLINRPRPAQVNPRIVPRVSVSANTPSYPSGHSYQAFLIAREYSKKYPELREKLFEIAEQCGQARIRAGLHYPSDHDFAKRLVLKNSLT